MSMDVTSAIRTELRKAQAESERWQQRVKALQTALATLSGTTTTGPAGRKRRRMTAAQRRDVSRRMKAYWEKRRAQKKR